MTTSVYDAVIFDMDGVLMEPTDEKVFTRGLQRTLERIGIPDLDTELYEPLRSVSEETPEALVTLEQQYGINRKKIWKTRQRQIARAQQTAINTGDKQPFSDVTILDMLPVKTGIVSNNQHEVVMTALKTMALQQTVETYYGVQPTFEDLHARKPSPTYLTRAIEDLQADHPVYVGDSGVDLVAARRAGIDAVLIDREETPGPAIDVTPTYTVKTLPELSRVLSFTNSS